MRDRALRDRVPERGAILIHVSLSIFALMAMSAFVFDYGVLWMSRRQAQNAADAGALAGATALFVDSSTDVSNTGPAYMSALTVAQAAANNVFGETPGVRVFVDPAASWDHPAPPPSTAPGAGCNTGEICVQVDAYRDGTHGSNTLPVYFANLFGQASQGIKATATAKAAVANSSGCMRPWFIPDRYIDNNGDSAYEPGTDTLNSYSVTNPPPYGDIGTAVVFHANSAPSSYGQIDVGSGGSAIRDAIEHCASGSFAVGQAIGTKPGNTLGPEKQGIDSLLAWDPDQSPSNPNGVVWDNVNKVVAGGCAAAGTCACPTTASTCPYGGSQSPRIVQAAICDPAQAACNGNASGAGTITITNILSFFITGYTSGAGSLDINAIIIGSAGNIVSGPTVGPGSSFLKQVVLVR